MFIKKISFSIFIINILFATSFLGKYSATTDGGYYSHYIELYSNGTYSSQIFGETSWGDWIEDGGYIKLYTQGFNIENLYIRNDSFNFGGVKFTKIRTTYNHQGSKNKINSPVGQWSALISTVYGSKSPYKMRFYSDGTYSESFAGNTSYGDWEIKSNKIILTGSDGMPAWSGTISGDLIALKSTSPYFSSLTIELNRK